MFSDDPIFPIDPEMEDESGIFFDTEDILFAPSSPELLRQWISRVIEAENGRLGHIQYIFCSDDYLLEINRRHLGHDYLTDIITFPYKELPDIEGDIFVSIDRVEENADQMDISFREELARVMIHGILHLCGFGDKTEEEAAAMRAKEDEALLLLAQLK